jgi:ABC-type uncharacterized transport system ATPase subunit
MSALLQVDKISKRFGGFTALREVSFDLNDGERFGIIVSISTTGNASASLDQTVPARPP